MLTTMRRLLAPLLAVAAAAVSVAGSQVTVGGELGQTLDRVGQRVEEFYSRARTITSIETVRIQPLTSDFGPARPQRQLVYELRIAWEPSVDGIPPEPTVLRQLIRVNGRPPRPKDEP